MLVVDDEPDLRTLTSRRLRRAGYEVTEARDGEEAWELTLATAPLTLVLDVRMPKLDGIALTERLRSDDRTSNVGIILLTASVEEHQQAEGAVAGADAYLRKPCTGELLVETVRSVIAARLDGDSEAARSANRDTP
ncbi:MAG: hypothetical protein JWM86_2764 [Thermoleophilia bacterium]|nr:hypothetical protein [Thermoleophilia bacterium]